jgi:prolipoprotein diacylglyceryltransferase
LLLVIAAAVVYSQARIYSPHVLHANDKVAISFPHHEAVVAQANPAVVATAPVSTGSAAGTEAQPVVVKLLPAADAEAQAAEHEKDRQVQQGIEHYAGRMAATALAENFLQLFQAVIYFLTLIIIYMLMENVKKFADAASKSAEAARKSAETAQLLLERREKSPQEPRKMPPHFYRKR